MARKKQAEDAAATIEDADAAVTDAAAPYRKTPLVRALSFLSELGDQPQMRTLSLAVAAAGVAGGNARLARAGARMLAAHELATATKNVVKRRVDRSRPRSRHEGSGHRIKSGESEAKEETSFPSGHSAGAASVARAFAREFPEYGAAAAGAAGLVALAQIPRCAHYPSDVGAGIAIGLAAEAAVDAAARLAGAGRDG
jgi:undecaprenyl-diphosphatase